MAKRLVYGLIVILILTGLNMERPALIVNGQTSGSPLNCHFGITAPGDSSGIDLLNLRVSAFLNWGATEPSTLAEGVDFIHVLRVGVQYETTKNEIETLVPTHLGAYWVIGNEPDTTYEGQDNVTAEEYAIRFYTLASRIRELDATSKIGFGSIVQPTPIRLRYMDKAWNKLADLAGSPEKASNLIDFWTFHSFILNEIPGQWGTGVPAGFENDHADAVKITNFSDTYSINIFSTRVKNFRIWMANKGEQNKPLWITEYGSLFPPIDPPGGPNLVNVSDSNTRDFMLKTFDFMLKTTDGTTGLPSDKYHLVQRWFWYSLNDFRYKFGGSWYDPSKNPPRITTVGTGYINYTAKNNVNPEFHFTVDPLSIRQDSTDPTKYYFNFNVENSGSSLEGSAKIWVYYDNPNEPPITSIDTDLIKGCGGMIDVSFALNLPASPSNVSEVFFRLDTNADLVPNSGDEIRSIDINTQSTRSPANGILLLNNRPTFTWGDVAGATGYTLQVSTVSNFSSFTLNTTTSAANYTMTSDLVANRPMFWRFRAQFGSTYGAWSAVWQFNTANSPSIPILLAPTNNSLITIYTPLLDWKDSSNLPHHYQVQIATENTFSSTGLVKDTTITSSSYTSDSLQPNKLFYWRVRTFNSDGQYSAWSSIWSFRTAIVPPTLLSPADGTSLSDRRPPLDWDDVSGASGYYLQISKYNNFSSTVMTGSPTLSKFTLDSDLPANTKLYWRVQAKGTNGPSAWSSVWSFTTANPPGVPLLSSPSNNALVTNYRPKLDWSNSSLPLGTTFAYYQVQVATENTFASPLLDEQVTDLLTSDYTPANDLAPNATYYWRVKAFNTFNTAVQYSAWSSTRSFRTAIVPPTLLSPADGTSLSDRRPPLDWDDVSGASGYYLQISKYNNFSSTVKTSSLTASTYTPSSDLPANTKLYWRVQAKGTNGPSAWSSVWSFTTLAPSAPLIVSPTGDALLSTQGPTLAWSSSVMPDGTTFAHYQVQVATDEAFTALVLDVQQQGLDSGEYTPQNDLAPDSMYYWRVRAFDTAGQSSDWSAMGGFRIPLPPPTLAAPEDGATLLNLRPELEWKDVSGSSGYALKMQGYDVQIAKDGDFTSPLVSGMPVDSTFTLSDDLPANTKLFWRVRAEGASGPGLWSVVNSFTTANIPGVPTLLSPIDGALLSEEHPTLAWNSAQLPEVTDFAYYQVQVATEDTFATPLLDMQQPGLDSTTCTITIDLAPDAVYYWRVRAVNTAGQSSAWSSTWSIRIPLQPPVLSAPEDGAIAVTLRPTLEWEVVSGASGYTVEISADSNFNGMLVSDTIPNPSFTPTIDLPSSTKLYWKVQAQGKNGPSNWSVSKSFTIIIQ